MLELTDLQKTVIDEVILDMMNKDNYPNNLDAAKLAEKLDAIVDANEETFTYFGQRALELGEELGNSMGTIIAALTLAFMVGINPEEASKAMADILDEDADQ